MKISLNTFQIKNNYVLILPDAPLQTLQLAGKETGLYSPDFTYEKGKLHQAKERNLSTTGTVYAVPQKLNFFLEDMDTIRKNNTLYKTIVKDGVKKNICINWPVQKKIDELYRNSVNFKTEVEVKPGDKVTFAYMAHKECEENGRLVETDLGHMMLIKYDQLYYTITEKQEPITMLNGWMVVEPSVIEADKFEINDGTQSWQVEGFQRESGLVIPSVSKVRKNKKIQLGTILYLGRPCKKYLQDTDATDYPYSVRQGEEIIYDPREALKMEFDAHQVFSEKNLYLIQRKDIKVSGADPFFTDISRISFERKKKK